MDLTIRVDFGCTPEKNIEPEECCTVDARSIGLSLVDLFYTRFSYPSFDVFEKTKSESLI